MKRYNPKEIEPKWQQKWADSKIYEAEGSTDKPKKYILEYFPYPSGAAMHVGHVRNYTIGDALARHARMNGYNVLHPMGWDAFGLPAENYAIKTGVSPQQAIIENTGKFKRQLTQMGFSYDWSREFASSDPEYYRWTQWFFLLLHKRGLAYRKESNQWWCPIDKTVLANEQVEDGKCWRCGSVVEKKALPQWFFKITDYADRLAADLDEVNWTDSIKNMQRNWIGRSEGAEITWEVCDDKGNEEGASFKTFTTRKDTLPGVTFIVVAPESPALDSLTADDHKARVHSYRQEVQSLTDVQRQEDKEKTGVFTGKYAKNPFNGKPVPIYAASYVLAGYGTGVVMGMGGHDLRDREFALKHDIPMILTTEVPEGYEDLKSLDVYKGPGKQINTGTPYDGMDNKQAGDLIFEKIVKEGKAEAKVNYKVRDWLISRQRYWGAPIPVVHCEKDGIVPIPEDQLPVVLPELTTFEPSGDGRSPLARVEEWVNTTCPTCGGPAQRETDTMDGFACSSWYFLRFADPKNDKEAFDPAKIKYWLPVDDYIGGAEHAVMHLLYARMWTKVMQDAGLIGFGEPFKTLRNHGMILAPDGSKMSKSKGNTIEPGILIDQGYGADAIRIMELFIGPWNQAANWSVEGMGGAFRFLQRVWAIAQEYMDRGEDMQPADDLELKRCVHRAIQRVSKDLEDMGFNTAIAGLMEAVNELYKLKALVRYEQAPETWDWAVMTLVQLLAPFAPHISEELWEQLGKEGSVHQSTWPAYDDQYLVSDTMTIVVQVNGKLRAQLEMPSDASKEQILEAARADEKVAGYVTGEPKKSVYVPGKLVNFVV
ncbi:MAG TPA: leucine--tRNA ligase [Candidatus Saccharimonadales bacterium]|nr:leucine--tRNA ligase [Candidatus Saccharimonadales bacterium]